MKVVSKIVSLGNYCMQETRVRSQSRARRGRSAALHGRPQASYPPLSYHFRIMARVHYRGRQLVQYAWRRRCCSTRSMQLLYITCAVVGAMRHIAGSYDDQGELNRVGFALYADFRPEVSGWGKRGRLRCETLLGLRKRDRRDEPESELSGVGRGVETTGDSGQGVVKHDAPNGGPPRSEPEDAFCQEPFPGSALSRVHPLRP
ncbi:hypothetical protein BGY98DRAFT_582211 [Russula aff. rugulosa BPL654]|nr:hypothetical protein BGY98DRAFT_582211 [Russula aff. rugulosa BPL654]